MDFKFKDIHIGSLIRQLVEEREIDEDRIINFFMLTDDKIERMFEFKSMDTEMLLRWSKLLEYDFFRIYSLHLVWYAPTYSHEMSLPNKNKESKLPQFRKNVYTAELIKFIVELVQSGEKRPFEIIKDYRIPKNTLYRWLHKHGKKTTPNYKKIYTDLIEKKYPDKKKECEFILKKESLEFMDVIQLNVMLFKSTNKKDWK